MIKITISENEENQRLDRFLKKYFRNAPLSYIYKLIRKDVKLNGKRAAIETVRFPFKFVPLVLLAIGGIGGLIRLSRPEGRLGVFAAILALAAGLLVGSVVVELAVVPADRWARLAMGHNARHCLTLTPFLAIAPLTAALIAARHGATTRPALTGAVAGLAAAGVGALLYAMNCNDDSPLFVALWYPLAVAIVAGAGALFGRRLLVW